MATLKAFKMATSLESQILVLFKWHKIPYLKDPPFKYHTWLVSVKINDWNVAYTLFVPFSLSVISYHPLKGKVLCFTLPSLSWVGFNKGFYPGNFFMWHSGDKVVEYWFFRCYPFYKINYFFVLSLTTFWLSCVLYSSRTATLCA